MRGPRSRKNIEEEHPSLTTGRTWQSERERESAEEHERRFQGRLSEKRSEI